MNLPQSADVVVLGAGPAGLGAAWRAAGRGLEVVVLERADALGGAAGSFEVAGMRVDHGSHRLHPATPAHILTDLRALLGDDLQTRPRSGRLRLGDRWVRFPLRPAELVRALPAATVGGIVRDAATGPLRSAPADTYADVLRAGLGPTVYDSLYAPYALKLWGLPPERIDGEQARRRVTADSPWKVAARILRGRRGSGQGAIFYYPRRGFGQICDVLADAGTAAGARIHAGTVVDRVDTTVAGSPVVHTSAGSLQARHVLSSVPLPVLGRVTAPPAPAEALDAASRLTFRAMVLVYLVHEPDMPSGARHGMPARWTPYDAHYLPGPETPVTRISEPANYRDSADDPFDHTVLCAEIPCAVGDDIWNAPDSDLGELVREGLRRTGLPPVRLAAVTARRMPNVYPVYQAGFSSALDAVEGWAAGLADVTTFGRLGLFAHDNTHHALVTAYEAVDALTWTRTKAGNQGREDRGLLRRDEDAWSAARQRFRSHVVED